MRRGVLSCLIVLLWALPQAGAAAATDRQAMQGWYRLVLELVRHTPTYSPPVASRAFAYLGVTGYEAVASGDPALRSLAGQLTDLDPLPAREPGLAYDDEAVVQAALARSVAVFFENTGPTGQRAIAAMTRRQGEAAAAGVAPDTLARSEAYGRALADHIIAWSQDDGGAVVENMGFPYEYQLTDAPGHWVPTSRVAQQQLPLLPDWGRNRPFAMQRMEVCDLPPPPAYSEEPGSAFHAEALEVSTARRDLTPEQTAIARFWSDDPMLSPTPPGHWISITWQILDRDDAGLAESADVMARLGVGMADAFIGCWRSKFAHDLVRPVTYIRKLIDPEFEPLLITPPFPEYPSGHSTLSGAAATVLTASFGEGFGFEDATHEDDGLPARPFPSFWAAAAEAAISRLYGGIHFRAAVEQGLEQGRCIGTHATALRTRR
ncbi:MAG: phosphoesterase PA-phosphatase [Cereibacter sp.]|jgi:hypothetical protein|nr:phosphoesterase PA-phosphatase [Cereibacter sp.]